MLTVNEKLEKLRALMREEAVDASYIGTADPHDSEYVAPHYQARAWLTGFTGSAGTAVVTADRALLWADGRYHIQAEAQLAGTPFELMKQGAPGVPSVEDWLGDSLPPGGRLAADGRLLPEALALLLEEKLGKREITLVTDLDPVGPLWENRPPLPTEPVFPLDRSYTGSDTGEKIGRIRASMAEDGADYALFVGLDDIAWLMNFRGGDVPHNPVALAFSLVTADQAFLFIDPVKLDGRLVLILEGQGVQLLAYEDLVTQLGSLSPGLLAANPDRVSRALVRALPEGVKLLKKRLDYPHQMKAVLNPVEIQNQFRAGIRDSVAVARYLHYVKRKAGEGLGEIELAEKLHHYRAESDLFITESFPTISAYGANAAMMHYQATPEQYSRLEPRGFYLVDCGAQSYEGTTDITRTISLGPLTDQERRDYTLTLKSHIALASLPFLSGTSGTALDAIARSVMWRQGLDYKCGTGHGFGYLLGVHEGPQRLTPNPELGNFGFVEGLVITIEPGIYRQGQHGIRLENDYLVLPINRDLLIKGESVSFQDRELTLNEAGDLFLRFQTMTFVPFDREAIDPALLTGEELDWLNDYNLAVREAITPYLGGDELAFVLEETEPF